jgi:hypothetical protein
MLRTETMPANRRVPRQNTGKDTLGRSLYSLLQSRSLWSSVTRARRKKPQLRKLAVRKNPNPIGRQRPQYRRDRRIFRYGKSGTRMWHRVRLLLLHFPCNHIAGSREIPQCSKQPAPLRGRTSLQLRHKYRMTHLRKTERHGRKRSSTDRTLLSLLELSPDRLRRILGQISRPYNPQRQRRERFSFKQPERTRWKALRHCRARDSANPRQ